MRTRINVGDSASALRLAVSADRAAEVISRILRCDASVSIRTPQSGFGLLFDCSLILVCTDMPSQVFMYIATDFLWLFIRLKNSGTYFWSSSSRQKEHSIKLGVKLFRLSLQFSIALRWAISWTRNHRSIILLFQTGITTWRSLSHLVDLGGQASGRPPNSKEEDPAGHLMDSTSLQQTGWPVLENSHLNMWVFGSMSARITVFLMSMIMSKTLVEHRLFGNASS